MKPIQLVLVGVAGLSAIGAGVLMMNLNSRPAPVAPAVQKVEKVPESKVLIASTDIPLGTSLTSDNMKWESWPDSLVRDAYITEGDKPEAREELSNATARASFFAGEPIRESKIVHSDSGYLSAILPAGKRAMGLQIDAQSSAGGFILPNDHVDVLLPYVASRNSSTGDLAATKTILQNIRVLAIDQVVEEQSGERSIIGRTVTLEVTAEQAELLASANFTSRGKLALALRSVEDAQLGAITPRVKRDSVRIIKYGKSGVVVSK